MGPPSVLLLTALLFNDVCLSQLHRCEGRFHSLIRRSTFNVRNINSRSIELKLSPVPPEAEGLPSPPVPELLGTEYEVHGAPAAPANNFILHPVSQGTRPNGAYPSNANEKPQVYGTNDHYFINQQGNLVLRPQYGFGQLSSGPPPLNFNESPPPFPHLTDEELYMLGQPVPNHQNSQGYAASSPKDVDEASIPSGTGHLVEDEPSMKNMSLHSTTTPEAASSLPPKHQQLTTRLPVDLSQPTPQPVHPSILPNQTLAPPKQPSTLQKLPTAPSSQQPIHSNQPSVTPSRPVGEYIATVSYGPSKPSLVYTCIPTPQLGRSYVQGPFGYSCKMSQARPSLSTHLLAANKQKPVMQPVVSTEPLPLPIVTPIKFFDAVH